MRHQDFHREIEDMFDFVKDDEQNYLGLSHVDVVAGAILKREERIAERDRRIAQLEDALRYVRSQIGYLLPQVDGVLPPKA